MTDPIVITAKSSLAKILAVIAAKLEAGQNREVIGLKQFADVKFRQIERTHRFFLDLLSRLHGSAVESRYQLETSGLRKAWKALSRDIESVRHERERTSEERREQYEEARVYSGDLFLEKGILKKIPNEIAEHLKLFMLAYCKYFQNENIYSHNLKRDIVLVTSMLERFKERLPRFKAPDKNAKYDFEVILKDFMTGFEESGEELRANWASVAEAYHRLNRSFREHGMSEDRKQRSE